jgi:hypothetical protein
MVRSAIVAGVLLLAVSVPAEARAEGRTAPSCYPVAVSPVVFRDVPANVPRFVYPTGVDATKRSVTFVEVTTEGNKSVALTYEEGVGRTNITPAVPLTVGSTYRFDWDPLCNELASIPSMEFRAAAAAPMPTAFASNVDLHDRDDRTFSRGYDLDVRLEPSFAPWVHLFAFELRWDGGPATYTASLKAEYVEAGGRHRLRGEIIASCPTQPGEPASATTHTVTIRASSPSFDGVFDSPPATLTLTCPSREGERIVAPMPAATPAAGDDEGGGCVMSKRSDSPMIGVGTLVAIVALLPRLRRRFRS